MQCYVKVCLKVSTVQKYSRGKRCLSKTAMSQTGKGKAQHCLLPKVSQAVKEEKLGVCVPTSMANVLSPMLLLPFLYSASLWWRQQRITLPALAGPLIPERWGAFLFPFIPVVLLCWKTSLSRTCTRTHRNVQNPEKTRVHIGGSFSKHRRQRG